MAEVLCFKEYGGASGSGSAAAGVDVDVVVVVFALEVGGSCCSLRAGRGEKLQGRMLIVMSVVDV